MIVGGEHGEGLTRLIQRAIFRRIRLVASGEGAAGQARRRPRHSPKMSDGEWARGPGRMKRLWPPTCGDSFSLPAVCGNFSVAMCERCNDNLSGVVC